MVSPSMLRHFLSDEASLGHYRLGKTVKAADIIRSLLLRERSENRKLGDHHYRLQQEKDFQGLDTLPDILRLGIFHMANDHLEMRGNRIHVRQERQNDWQQLITYIPPLLLQAAFLHIQRPLTDTSATGLQRYKQDYLLPNFRYTALPYPYVPQIENYLAAQNGFHDLHMHLNGSTETDIAWQDHLFMPKKIHEEMLAGFQKPKVKEQFEQESHLLDPDRYYELLLIARKIRALLYEIIVLRKSSLTPGTRIQKILSLLNADPHKRIPADYQNPFGELIGETVPEGKLIVGEALMYVLLFDELARRPRESVASLFHFYLLILGLCNRLLVQQLHQYGFEQFQKHTLNGLRETSEKKYRSRFFQLHGNELRNLAFLEGRFSPQETEKATIALLNGIRDGWQKLLAGIRATNPNLALPELRLTAHFIKRPEKAPTDDYIRFRELRVITWKKAKVLALLRKNQEPFTRDIVGIDAAASEFDTPPEVFAPAFRMLRRKNFRHFTYHAGEDFFHLLSGLRAIFEAIDFTGLHTGDRIGHATAAGLSAQQWCNAVGTALLIRRGEWLDDLTFSYHLCLASTRTELRRRLPDLDHAIQQLSWAIYHKAYPVTVLEAAWRHRKYCPILLFSATPKDARRSEVFDPEEWDEISGLKLSPQTDVYQVLFAYHFKANRQAYDQIITIDPQGIFCAEELELLQKEMLTYMHRKEIVIETLPTSNVRIGHHPDFSTYHLWNWIEWADKGNPVPPIVFGTDDTGIFATNILNEAANIYCYLTQSGKMTHSRAMDVIKDLNEKSKIYRFT